MGLILWYNMIIMNRCYDKIKTDDETGLLPTERQVEILFLLNPFRFDRTYKDAAEILGISVWAIQKQMSNLKKRCPAIYKRFKKLRKGNWTIRQPLSLDSLNEDYGKYCLQPFIKEKF